MECHDPMSMSGPEARGPEEHEARARRYERLGGRWRP